MPKELATQMLKTIIRMYDGNPVRFSDPGMALDIWELAVKTGIFTEEKLTLQNFYSGNPWRDAIDTVIDEMKRRGWVDTNGTAGQTWIWPLPAGIDEGRRLMRPGYQKVWDFFKGDIRTIVVAVITALIITILTTWILRRLGW